MKKKDGRVNNGGARPGSGRKKTKEDTKVMRIPLSKVEEVKKLLKKASNQANFADKK